ncbi:MAG: hypothetical protein GX752_07900 [Clostridium sp.]|nr:hypothetical protein [Clostridium sp.]
MGLDVFGENLSDFGKSLSDYGETVSGIKMEAITGSLDAVDALVLISNKLEGETGSMKSLFTGGTYTLSNLGTDLQMLGGSLKKYSDSILDLRTGNMKNANDILDDLIRIANDMQSIKGAPMTQFGADLKRLGEMGLDGYVEAFEKSDKTIKETIDAIMDSAKKAITDKQPELESEMETAMNGVVKEIKEGAESAKTEAVFIPVGIIEAIQEEAASLRQAGEDLALEISSSASSKENIVIKAFITPIDNAIKEIKKRKPEFQDLGKDIVLGISDGMRFNTFIATQAAKNMASAVLSAAKYELSISSPSKAFREEVGRMISQGTAEGIIKDRNKAVGAASELSASILSKAKEWIADRKHFSDLTLAEEKYVLTEINKAIKKNSKERIEIKKEMYTLEQVMSSEWLADQKFYNKLTLEDEINYWKQRRELYREGTEEYKTASKELYTLERQQSSDWLDEEKFYNRISLKEELEYWKQRLKTAKKGTQEYKEIAREIYTLEKEIANIRKQYAEDQKALYENAARDRERALKTYQDQVKTAEQNLLRDVEQVNKEYENALKSRSDTLYNAYGLFSKVSVKDRVSGFDLVLNLEGQLKEFEEWQYLLESLTDKKLSEELLKELANMGPSAVAELRGLNELTEGELVTYEELWNKKRNLADSQALKDMQDARIKADEEITKIRTSHAEQLSELQSEYNKTLSEINSELASNLATLNRSFLESMKEINDDVETEASVLEDLLKEDYKKNKEDLESRLTELTDLIKDAFTATDWAELGSGVITGIQSGINKLMPSLIKTARSIAAKTLAAIKEELGINSPSKEGEYVGEFTIDGLINGMFKMIPKVEETAKEVGDKAIDALFIPLALIADILENDIDMSPTIRPVLDLSDIKEGTDILNRMMNGRSYSTNLAYTTSGTIKRHRQQNHLENKLEKVALGLEELNKTQETKREIPQFVQNNYSPKALSRIDIYRQTKNQFTAAKGVLDKV